MIVRPDRPEAMERLHRHTFAFLLGTLLAGLSSLDASPYSDGKKSEKLGNYEEAFKSYQQAYSEKSSKRYLEALQRVGKIVARDRYVKAEAYWQETQDIDGARTRLEETLKFDEANPQALSLKEKIGGRRNEALKKLQASLADSEAGRHEEALKVIKFAELLYSGHQPIQDGWLTILKAAVRDRINQSDFVKGAELLREGAGRWDDSQLNDVTAELHLAVGKALVADGDYKSAIDACSKAEALVPDLAGLVELRKAAQENLAGQLERDGRDYVAKKKWQLAVDNFTEAFLLNPSFEGIQEKIVEAKKAQGQELLKEAREHAESQRPANALLRYIAASLLTPESDELGEGVERAKKSIEDRVTFRVGIRGFDNASNSPELPDRLANELMDYLFQKSLDTLQIVDLSGEQWATEIAEQTGAERERKKPISVFIDGSVYPVKKEVRKIAAAQTSQVQVGRTKVPNPDYASIVASQSAIIRVMPELGKTSRSSRKAPSGDLLGSLLKMAELYNTESGGGKKSSSLNDALKMLSGIRNTTSESGRTYSSGRTSGTLGQALGVLAAVQSSRSRSKSSGPQAQRIAAALGALEALKSQNIQPGSGAGGGPGGFSLKSTTIEILKTVAQEDSQRKSYALAKRELDRLEAELRSTPKFTEEPVYASAQSGGETQIKTALASCYVKIREFKSGKLRFSRRFSNNHTVSNQTSPGNPELGIAPVSSQLPSDIQVEETVIGDLFSEVCASIFAYLRNYGAGYLMLAQQQSGDSGTQIERQLDYLFSYTARDNPGQVRDLYLELQAALKSILPRSLAPRVPSALEEFLGAMPEVPSQ